VGKGGDVARVAVSGRERWKKKERTRARWPEPFEVEVG
jgi:hypothetical protein